MNGTTFTIIFLAFLIAIFMAWFFIHRSKEKERLLLIEKGLNPSELPEWRSFNFTFPWLKVGCIIISVTIGLIVGLILYHNGYKEGPTPLIGMLLFGGIGMIIAHYLDKPDKSS